jgi:hypothetical protein
MACFPIKIKTLDQSYPDPFDFRPLPEVFFLPVSRHKPSYTVINRLMQSKTVPAVQRNAETLLFVFFINFKNTKICLVKFQR